MTTRYDLEQAYYHNIANNQIGAYKGITEEVAADLGFESYEGTRELIHVFETRQTDEIQTGLGGLASKEEKPVIYCGDCGQPMPCSHGGNGITRGY